MIRPVLFAAMLLQTGLAGACAAQPAAISGSIFCQADTDFKQTPQTQSSEMTSSALAASGFCADVQAAFTQALGAPVPFASETDAEWVITVGVSAYRAHALIVHNPSTRRDTVQFDIMDAPLTPVRLRPFAAGITTAAIGLRPSSAGSSRPNLE